MHTLNNTRSLEFMNRLFHNGSIFSGKHQFCFSRTRNLHLYCFIDIPISMSCNRDWLFPGTDIWLNPFYDDRCTENRTIQNCTNRSIWALPHFFQMIFLHTGCIRCDSGTLYSDSIFSGGLSTVYGHLIIGRISVFKPEIIILCLQINKRKQKLLFDHGPENSGHLISIHLYQRCFHCYFIHVLFLHFLSGFMFQPYVRNSIQDMSGRQLICSFGILILNGQQNLFMFLC